MNTLSSFHCATRLSRLVGILTLGAGVAGSAAHAASPQPSDANIAAIVVTANTIDIKAGRLAEKRGHAADVRDFGTMMVRDHTAVNGQATALVKKLGVTPQPNDLSRKLETDAGATYRRIDGLRGAAFDRAYIDNEVAYHQAVISVVEGQLIPAAHNAELKALLQQVLPALQAHLEHARQVQATLK